MSQSPNESKFLHKWVPFSMSCLVEYCKSIIEVLGITTQFLINRLSCKLSLLGFWTDDAVTFWYWNSFASKIHQHNIIVIPPLYIRTNHAQRMLLFPRIALCSFSPFSKQGLMLKEVCMYFRCNDLGNWCRTWYFFMKRKFRATLCLYTLLLNCCHLT